MRIVMTSGRYSLSVDLELRRDVPRNFEFLATKSQQSLKLLGEACSLGGLFGVLGRFAIDKAVSPGACTQRTQLAIGADRLDSINLQARRLWILDAPRPYQTPH